LAPQAGGADGSATPGRLVDKTSDKGRQESSFCEQKEAKKLFSPHFRRWGSPIGIRCDQREKSFLVYAVRLGTGKKGPKNFSPF
jgi:hypothetical protein